MTSTRSAAATRLPAAIPSLTGSMPRRGFLAGLTRLPLIGGSVALLGQPSAVAEPATRQILEAYKTWLHYEQRSLAWEMSALPEMVAYYGGTRERRLDLIESLVIHQGTGGAPRFHRFDGTSPASSRAALVLSAVGCDWRDPEAPSDWLLPVRRV